MLHLHGVAGQFLDDLIKIALHAAEAQIFGGGGQSGAGLGSLFGGGGGGGGGFGGLLKGVLSIFGGGGGGAAAAASSAAPSLGYDLAGFLADGGPAQPGKTYMVGERGPELLRMGATGGTVIPNHAITSFGNMNARVNQPAPQVTVVAPLHFDLSNAVMTPDLLNQMNRISQTHAQNYAGAAYKQAVTDAGKQAPAAVRYHQIRQG
jgi:hypothetical protein